MTRFQVVTLFPEFFGGALASGLLGKALTSGIAAVATIDPRTFTADRHKTVDDAPYGGGAGMVMKPEPLVAAIEAARAAASTTPRVLALTPQGRPLLQEDLQRWSAERELILVAGRYEGFDERVLRFVDEEVSIGDYVLTGGEYGALVIIDGVVRLLPGTLGNVSSPLADSFSAGLLEHAQYTRPPEFRGLEVPATLLSGDHGEVAAERLRDAVERTRRRRPDLLAEYGGAAEVRAAWRQAATALPPLAAVLCLGPASPAPVSEWIALVAAYGLAGLWIVAPGERGARISSRRDALEAALREAIAAPAPRPRRRPAAPPPAAHRAEAAGRLMVAPDLAAALAEVASRWPGVAQIGVGPEGRDGPRGVRRALAGAPAAVVVAGATPPQPSWVLPEPRSPAASPLLETALLVAAVDRLVGEG